MKQWKNGKMEKFPEKSYLQVVVHAAVLWWRWLAFAAAKVATTATTEATVAAGDDATE